MSFFLDTERLRLRVFRNSDAPALMHLLQDRDISLMTLRIPYPYSKQNAMDWIDHALEAVQQGSSYPLAIIRREDYQLLGSISLGYEADHQRGELGYWIGSPYQGQGYATEAAQGLIRFGFWERRLNRIYATCFVENEASARVMQKCGMQWEGTLRQHVFHRITGSFRDVHLYGLLRHDYPPAPA